MAMMMGTASTMLPNKTRQRQFAVDGAISCEVHSIETNSIGHVKFEIRGNKLNKAYRISVEIRRRETVNKKKKKKVTRGSERCVTVRVNQTSKRTGEV
jgi:uncharacterized protein YkuJ